MEKSWIWSDRMTDLSKINKPLFVFDLDSTITKCELLPLIAEDVGLGRTMARLTECAMQENAPFEQNFCNRVELLKGVSVSRASFVAARMPMNEKIVEFIRGNPQRCMILTGNLDVWIAPVIEKLGMTGRCLCSKALVDKDHLIGIASVLDKASVCQRLPHPFVAIGDGSNDIDMLEAAEIGIAFGGVHNPCKELVAAADMVIWEEKELVEVLKKLL